MVTIRQAVKDEMPLLVAVAVRAFGSQAMTKWLLGEGESGKHRIGRMAEMEYMRAMPFGQIYATDDRNGLAIWYPPHARFSLWQRLLHDVRLAGVVKFRAKTWKQVMALQAVEAAHPAAPHYYLRLLAVAPEYQGCGIGTALMQPVLRACDDQRVPAYLETDTEKNVAFYQRRGFRVQRKIDIPGTGLSMWTLWREPFP